MTLLEENRMPGPAVIDGIEVDAVAAAVAGCAGVSALDGGPFGEVASYLPGRKVPPAWWSPTAGWRCRSGPSGEFRRQTWPRRSPRCWRR